MARSARIFSDAVINFKINKPALYMIHNERVPLFIGKLMEPDNN